MMKKRRANRVTRRKVVKGMLAACVAGGAADALAAPATTQADAITSDDLAGADRVAGRAYSPAQLNQMAGIVTEPAKEIPRASRPGHRSQHFAGHAVRSEASGYAGARRDTLAEALGS